MPQNTSQRDTQYANLAHVIWWKHITEDRQMVNIMDSHFDQCQFAKFSKKMELTIAQCIYDFLDDGRES